MCALIELKRGGDPDARRAILATSLALFLLPISDEVEDNVLPEFVGRADGWYARHILTTFCAEVSNHAQKLG